MSKQTICLNMIVKNEEHVIRETLDNILSYIPIDYWVISDTGSTDKTKEMIKEYFKEKKIAGELVEHEWRDFGYNRTKALEAAYNKTDYLFIFDADDKICGNFGLPQSLNANMYHLQFGKDFTYVRPLLITNRKQWEFKGVLHEYLTTKDGSQDQAFILNGSYYIESGRLGDRSKNPTKYHDDALILEKAFDKEKEKECCDIGMVCRYAFYCAQSYKDCQMIDKSIEWYKKCLDLPNWVQEKYYSAFIIGTLLLQKNKEDEALKYFCKTVEYDAERIEGIVGAMEVLLKKGDHLLVNGLYHRFKNYNRDVNLTKLFVFKHLYVDRVEYFNSISASYVNDKESGYECCKKIIMNSLLSDAEVLQTVKNLVFYKECLEKDEDKSVVALFDNVDKIIFKHQIYDEAVSQIWKSLYHKRKKMMPAEEIDPCFKEDPTIIKKNMEFVFLQGIDQIGNDIQCLGKNETHLLLEGAANTNDCVACNTFGYLKHKIDKLEKVSWFSETDGIFIKKEVYEQMVKEQEEKTSSDNITLTLKE
uniref:Glycosyltransferase 2-like domain-containing protein n=1 Tax=viral metagenome TaxID=1070528 RepID=A0A6C0LDX7_9ZZZZ